MTDNAYALNQALTIMQWNGYGTRHKYGNFEGVKINPSFYKDLDKEYVKDGKIFGLEIELDSQVRNFEIGTLTQKQGEIEKGKSFFGGVIKTVEEVEKITVDTTKWHTVEEVIKMDGATKFAKDDLLNIV